MGRPLVLRLHRTASLPIVLPAAYRLMPVIIRSVAYFALTDWVIPCLHATQLTELFAAAAKYAGP